MPVSVVAAPAAPAVEPTSGAPAPAPGFEAALAARIRDPRLLPSVSLGAMVDALAPSSRPTASALTVPAPTASDLASAPAATTAPAGALPAGAADVWGATTDAPTGVATGPGAAVLEAGERYLGVPYRWGGTSASTGFDCSGFVQQVYRDVGVSLPRVSVDQSRSGVAVAGGVDQAQPGDLLFWRGNGSRPNHIAIYAGEGRMLVAPRTGDVVKYQEVTRTPDAIRRVIS